MTTDTLPRSTTTERPYARYAFLNPYNLVLLAGAIALGLLTGHDWLAVVAGGAELVCQVKCQLVSQADQTQKCFGTLRHSVVTII